MESKRMRGNEKARDTPMGIKTERENGHGRPDGKAMQETG